MSTRKTEVFESIKTSGLIFQNTTVSQKDSTIQTVTYPPKDSIMTVTDTNGTTGFTSLITADSLTIRNDLVATSASISSINVTTAAFNTLYSDTLTVKSANILGDNTTGYINASAIKLTDPASGTICTLDVSASSLRWTTPSGATDVLGWKTALTPTTNIPLLPPTATVGQVTTTLNQLLTVFKTKGIFIL